MKESSRSTRSDSNSKGSSLSTDLPGLVLATLALPTSADLGLPLVPPADAAWASGGTFFNFCLADLAKGATGAVVTITSDGAVTLTEVAPAVNPAAGSTWGTAGKSANNT